MNSIKAKLIRWGLAIVGIVFAFLALLSLLHMGAAFGLYAALAKWATVRLGLDYYAANTLAVALTSVILILLPNIPGILLPVRHRLRIAGVVVGITAAVGALVYTVGRDVYFDRTTGEPLRYYADTPDGRVFSFTPGFEPRYGIEFKPYTRDAVNREIEQKRREQSRQLERQKQEEEARRQQAIEAQRREADALRQQELERQRQEMAEARKQQAEESERQLELKRLEAAERQQALEQQRLEAQEQARQADEQRRLAEQQRQQEEAESRRREAERQRQEAQAQRQRQLEEEREQRQRDEQREAARRQEEEAERARKAERNRKIFSEAQRLADRWLRRKP